ncbi:MAG: 2TM domain-containing protein [Solirubrobacteraceae bacterium]
MADPDLDVVPSTPEELRAQALLRIKKRREFQNHVLVYVVINAVLWAIWAVSGTHGDPVPWPLWVTVFWGVGLAFNAWDVFGRKPITEEEIEREAGKLAGR